MEFVDDNLVHEEVGAEAQAVGPELTAMELEFLEGLMFVSTKVEDKKRDKFSVNVRRSGNSILFSASNLNETVEISFEYDLVAQKVLNLKGGEMQWVKDFLMKYRILED